MLTPPDWFVDDLSRQCNDRFRIRWSPSRLRWQIEEKAARARMADRPLSIMNDEVIREAEGFTLFTEIAPGSQIKCDRCQRWTKATLLQFKTTRCGWCQKELKAFYYPLNDALLQHLRKVNPETGGIDRVFQEVDQRASWREATRNRDRRNYQEAVGKDTFNFVHEIQSVGYSGRSNRFIHRDKGLR